MKPVSILIPVYNNFEGAVQCLQSVLRHTAPEVPVFIVDDASTEGDFKEALQECPSNITICRNEQNLGFTRSVNLGFAKTARHDLVILNSDTVVTANWLTKLQAAAYSRSRVGSVTPLTNNGTICSVPMFCELNELPVGYTLDEFAAVIEQVSEEEFPEIPTCVGFCTYFRREMLDAVGFLDEEHFPRGYGEENDLSCRLQRHGFVDILADNTFVYHSGGESFQGEQSSLMKEGEAMMRKLHPTYYPRVSRFVRENPLFPIQHRIQMELLTASDESSQSRILHILHNGPYKARRDPLGGTELHVQGLIEALPEFSHWSLVRDRSHYILQAHTRGSATAFHLPVGALEEILSREFFHLVHLHHSRWFDLSHLRDALRAHGNYIVSLHDFVSLCPRFHLFTVQGAHCSGAECKSACGYDEEFIQEYRACGLDILQNAAETIAFSKNTLRYLEKIFGKTIGARIVQHGIHLPSTTLESPSNEELSVLVLAPRGKHKGEALVRELFTHSALPSGKSIRWHVLGEWKKSGHEECHGNYTRENLYSRLKELSPDIGLLLSLCPETYGLAFDELIACGLPLVVGPLGAPAERVSEWRCGWIVSELTSRSVLKQIDSIAKDQGELREKCQQASKAPVRSMGDEAKEVSDMYRDHSSTRKAEMSLQVLLNRFEPGEPYRSSSSQLYGRGIEWVLGVLESMRLRAPIQKGLQHILGERNLERLKNLRG